MNTIPQIPASNSAHPRDISLGANLRRLQVLTRDWPGTPLDSSGAIRVLNPDAPGPPLFWCFNGRHEFPALANALAKVRPVVGMRSLNQIIPGGPSRFYPDMELAEHYATTLLQHFGPVRCLVGGNCQAAATAYGIAVLLQDRGTVVTRLITIDAVVRQSFSGHVRLLFSSDSLTHNPLLTQIAPDTAWQFIYGSHDSQILPAIHGQFFLPSTVADLARAIEADPTNSPDIRAPATSPLIWTCIGSTDPAADSFIELTAPALSSAQRPTDLAVLSHWRAMHGQSGCSGSWVSPADGFLSPVLTHPDGNLVRTFVKAPDKPGTWDLVLTLCKRLAGPLSAPVSMRFVIL